LKTKRREETQINLISNDEIEKKKKTNNNETLPEGCVRINSSSSAGAT
jgi:hypothetical protein